MDSNIYRTINFKIIPISTFRQYHLIAFVLKEASLQCLVKDIIL